MKEELFNLAISTIIKNAPNFPSFSELNKFVELYLLFWKKKNLASKLNEQTSKIKDVLNLIECPSYLKICKLHFVNSID